MTIAYRASLTDDEKKEAWEFLQKFDYIPYQQFPEYGFIEGLRSSFFIAREGNKIVGWLHVIEKKNILASIEFGPLGDNVEITIALLQKAFNYYRRKFFLVARWMPYWYVEEDAEMIRRQIEKEWPVLTNANLIHWASKRISLNEPEEAVLKKFSENHRRNIKKGNSFSIECRVIAEKKIIENFVDGYVKMYQHRNLQVDHSAVRTSFNKLHEFLIASGRGFFMGAFKDDVLLGGLIIIYQGKTAFYYKGYIDHEQRQMPINHVAFYQAILHSKQNNMQWFDFGGYAVDTTDEQLVNINKFKDGFKGELVQFSPSRMYGLNLLSRAAYSLLSLKNKILSR